MKAGWEVRPLGEVASVGAGNPAPQDKASFLSGTTPFIRTSDVGKIRIGEISNASDHVNDACGKQLRLVPSGTILMPKSGASTLLNHRVITTIDAFVSSHLATITANPDLLDPRFLFHAMTRILAQDLLPENSYPSLNLPTIKAATIPVPPLEEQRRIVAILDEAFEGLNRARANTLANLEDARALFEDEIDRNVLGRGQGWAITTLDAVCEQFEYGTSAKSNPSGRVPVLRMGNLQQGEIDWSDLVYTDSTADIEKLSLRPLDVLFNRTNSLEHVGKSAIYRGEQAAIFAGYLIRLRYNPYKIHPEFLNSYLNSRHIRAFGRSISGKSVNQANISAGKLKTYTISLPPISVQEEIVSRLEALREAIKNIEQVCTNKLTDLDQLRQSLLQKAFAGELT